MLTACASGTYYLYVATDTPDELFEFDSGYDAEKNNFSQPQAVQITAMASCTTAGVDDCPSFRGYLRLDATRNNQRRGVRLAEHYSLDAWLHSLGGSVAA